MNDLYWRLHGNDHLIRWHGVAQCRRDVARPSRLDTRQLRPPGVGAVATPSVPLVLRNVNDSLPSSAATLTFSACSGVTSNVTVRPKLLLAPTGFAVRSVDRQHAQALDDRLTDRAPSQRRVVFEGLGQDDIDMVARIQETRAGPASGHRDRDRPSPRREDDPQEVAIGRLDDGAAPDRVACRDAGAHCGAVYFSARLLIEFQVGGTGSTEGRRT